MSIDHGKLLAAYSEFFDAVMKDNATGESQRRRCAARDKVLELRALAQPAEAVDVFNCPTCPVSVESRWLEPRCPECDGPTELDSAAKPISDDAKRMLALESDPTFRAQYNDAGLEPVAPMLAIPEHIALYQGPDDCPHLQLNGTSVAIFPAGSWAAVCDALDSITGSKATHPQAAHAQGAQDSETDNARLGQNDDGWCTYCGCGNDAAGYAHLEACKNPHKSTSAHTQVDVRAVETPDPHNGWRRTRLAEIQRIIEAVDNRAMADDGPIRSTMELMTQTEMSRIYDLARGVGCAELAAPSPEPRS